MLLKHLICLVSMTIGCVGRAPETPRSGDTARGMTLVIGHSDMNQATEATCSVKQDESDQIRLSITIRSECATMAPLSILIWTAKATTNEKLERTLLQQAETTFDGPVFAAPEPGQLVRLRARACCAGTEPKEVWATARCVFPARR